ncbi:hypothetical protein ATANTOWER_009553 [Ataeniobius toweri]|uniref:Uncharacterized protein n=1 Tax=Ataeniobius toweri TaxID=208326 RepID=A0ABU7B7C6_9TELE|nr:hypothetical protein [Ataeniobius toweri]
MGITMSPSSTKAAPGYERCRQEDNMDFSTPPESPSCSLTNRSSSFFKEVQRTLVWDVKLVQSSHMAGRNKEIQLLSVVAVVGNSHHLDQHAGRRAMLRFLPFPLRRGDYTGIRLSDRDHSGSKFEEFVLLANKPDIHACCLSCPALWESWKRTKFSSKMFLFQWLPVGFQL